MINGESQDVQLEQLQLRRALTSNKAKPHVQLFPSFGLLCCGRPALIRIPSLPIFAWTWAQGHQCQGANVGVYVCTHDAR